MMIRKAGGAVAVVLAFVLLFPAHAVADLAGDVRYDGDFVRSLQLPNGAIVSDTTRGLVDPYVGNYAAWGLARVARRVQDPTYRAAAVAWLTWYQSHMDSSGAVHDQNVVDGVLDPTADEDSIDACNGIFLLAVREVWLATNGSARRLVLDRFRVGVTQAVAAIESLRDTDGMTWAKPTWHVKYLMDNAEAYGGLLAARELGAALGDVGLAARAADGARRTRAGVAGLWNPATQAYDWAKHANGYRQVTNWNVLYPDSVEQAWAVAYGLPDPARARDLLARFVAAQPSWDRPVDTATYWDGVAYQHTVDFWPVAGFGLVATGDSAGAAAAAARIREGAWQVDRQPPYTSGAQGQLILLETGGIGSPPLRPLP